MDLHLLAAINELLSSEKIPLPSTAWRCFCIPKTFTCESRPHNESISRCMVSSFKSTNIVMILSVNSGSFSGDVAFDSEVLKSLIKILLDDHVSLEDKEHTIHLLAKHTVLHPGCSVSLADTYRNLILEPLEEFTDETILQKILINVENTLFQNKPAVLNARLSRNSRKKKVSDDFYTEEDFQPKRRKQTQVLEEEPADVLEVTENDPKFRLAALQFIAETISHEFYSKCYAKCENRDLVKDTIAGTMFLKRELLDILLNEEITDRIIEIYKFCDESNRKPFSEIIELIANLCLFADSGELYVRGDIACPKQYPLAQRFCQSFIQSVFKRTSSAEANEVLKNIKPEWLRLNCARHVLKCSGKTAKGFSAMLEKLSALVEKCGLNDNDAASSEISDSDSSKYEIVSSIYDSIFEKRLTEDVCMILLNLVHSLVETYDLRRLQSLYEINVKKNITADSGVGNYEVYMREFAEYVKFKNLMNIISKIQNSPSYVNILKFI
ncbi:uncharacterized protein LOC135832471 [Planococcus citri]|uniref:uncharacterized protein LOC135832471 n=1 Tax=Planococcus citri TaxID=170843 RepID=UPI0031F9F121